MNRYVEIHKMYLSREGYHILLRVRTKGALVGNYIKTCTKKDKQPKLKFLEEPWRIVSEQMRQFKSLYVKTINKIRGRKGVLVQSRYCRYYFESKEEYEEYYDKMETGEKIESQEKVEYMVKEGYEKRVNWMFLRSKEWVGSVCSRVFQDLVVEKMIKLTLSSHSPKSHHT